MAHLGLLQNSKSGDAVFWELPMAHLGPLRNWTNQNAIF